MKILPIYAGYINLKPINGVIFPSYAQNQINKDYIVNKLNGEFFMSTNENTYGRNNIVLRSLLEEKKLSGICFLSAFALPNNKVQRQAILHLAIKKGKQLHFVFEENFIKDKNDIQKIENLLIFNTSFFTKKKTNLNKFEKQFLSKNWKFV